FICEFAIPANTANETFTSRGETTVAWTNTIVAIQPSNADGLESITMDNVVLYADFSLQVPSTQCIAPSYSGQNLVVNGDFSNGETGWQFWGEVTHSVMDQQLEFYRQTPSPNGASVYQVVNHSPQPGIGLALTLDL